MSDELGALSRKQMVDALKVIKYKKPYRNKNKDELIAIMEQELKSGGFKEYEAEKAIKVMREALGLSTHGNIKNRTQGIRKSKRDDAKSPKALADEALSLVKEALAMKGKPKLKKQLLARMMKEMDKFEEEIESIKTTPKETARRRANVSQMESSGMKQDF